jgi:hypothetical protein
MNSTASEAQETALDSWLAALRRSLCRLHLHLLTPSSLSLARLLLCCGWVCFLGRSKEMLSAGGGVLEACGLLVTLIWKLLKNTAGRVGGLSTEPGASASQGRQQRSGQKETASAAHRLKMLLLLFFLYYYYYLLFIIYNLTDYNLLLLIY